MQLLIPESVLVSTTKSLDDAIVLLLGLEKKCRTSNDTHTLKQLCVHMTRLCREKNDWVKLNSTIHVIDKRRNQSKFAVTAVVEECLTYIEQTPSKAVKIELIKALKDVCEGKMYLEAESARLHLMLALIWEADGDIAGSCEIIQDVHVETYGSLSKKEKAEYILQQVRLNLLRKDLVRALIHSRKMNKRTLEETDEGFDQVKIYFYRLMVQYHLHEKNYWEIAQCFYKIYDTNTTKTDSVALAETLNSCIAFLLLSKYNNAQNDMLHRIASLQDAQKACPDFMHVLTIMKTMEIVPSSFAMKDRIVSQLCKCCDEAGQVALKMPTMHMIPSDANPPLTGSSMAMDTESGPSGDNGEGAELNAPYKADCVLSLNTRVIEHNIRVLSRYYTEIRTARAADMLGLSVDELEVHLAEMAQPAVYGDVSKRKSAATTTEDEEAGVGGTTLYIRINRPDGIISFAGPKTAEATLSDWASDITGLFNLMETTCHLINRENMVYKV